MSAASKRLKMLDLFSHLLVTQGSSNVAAMLMRTGPHELLRIRYSKNRYIDLLFQTAANPATPSSTKIIKALALSRLIREIWKLDATQ